MSRELTSGQLAAAAGRHRQVAPLVEFHFASGVLNVTLAPWNIPVGATTYLALSPLATVRTLSEAIDSMEGMEFGMSGLDPGIIEIASSEPYRGRLVKLLKAYLDAETNQVIDAPRLQWLGRIRAIATSEKSDTATVTIQAEHYDIELQRAAPLRLNSADQQMLFPGDLGCEFVESLTEKTIVWPSKEALRR